MIGSKLLMYPAEKKRTNAIIRYNYFLYSVKGYRRRLGTKLIYYTLGKCTFTKEEGR